MTALSVAAPLDSNRVQLRSTALSWPTSSMKMMLPFACFSSIFFFASEKQSRTIYPSPRPSSPTRDPSPICAWSSTVADSLMNAASVCFAHARASSVFPVPGGP